MKLTLVCPFDPVPAPSSTEGAHVGGVERVFAEVSRRLAARDHDVTLLCSTADGPGIAEQDGVQVVRVQRRGLFYRTPIVDLAAHLPRDSDLVHVPATYPFTTVPVLKEARRCNIKSVLDFHFEPAPVGPFGRLAGRLYRLVGPPKHRLADAVMVRSYAYGRSAPSLSRVVPEARWRVVPNGIDPQVFRPDGPVVTDDYLLFVGRLVPYKGLSVLLHALKEARVGLPLVIVGNGPLRNDLQGLAERLGVTVDFRGHVADGELPALYRGARLTLLPSVNRQEAFGISLVESMACGTPVVASALPGVEEVGSFGGLVAPPGDVHALAKQIRTALEEGRLQRGPALAERTHARYSWDAVTERMVEVYAEVCGEATLPRAEDKEVTIDAHTRSRSILRS